MSHPLQHTPSPITPTTTHTLPNHTLHNTHLTQSHPPQHTPYPITPSTTHTLPNHTLHNTHLPQSHPPQHTPYPITPSTTHTLPNHTLHNTHLTQSHPPQHTPYPITPPQYSESSVIRTSIIRILDYPDCEIRCARTLVDYIIIITFVGNIAGKSHFILGTELCGSRYEELLRLVNS